MGDLRIHTRDLQNKKGGRINLLNRTQPFHVLPFPFLFFLSSCIYIYIYFLHEFMVEVQVLILF